MKEDTPQNMPSDPNNPILGKRHAYKDSQKDCIKTKAKELGFSDEEIKALSRIYKTDIQQN